MRFHHMLLSTLLFQFLASPVLAKKGDVGGDKKEKEAGQKKQPKAGKEPTNQVNFDKTGIPSVSKSKVNDDNKKSYIVLGEKDSLVSHLMGYRTNNIFQNFFQFDANNEGMVSYTDTLKTQHLEAANSAGLSESDITYHYVLGMNGFSAMMEPTQAAQLEMQKGVKAVEEDIFHPLIEDIEENLDLFIANNEIVTASTSPASVLGLNGEGIVVGVVDTGIWPEHPSFADDGSYPDPPFTLDESVRPSCDFGNTDHNPDDAPFTCNNKLIGARALLETYNKDGSGVFDSARDSHSHGTHVASTAAGNINVDAIISNQKIATISGVAHRAHIIAYKAGSNGFKTSDLIASVDQAIADRVDVLNFSLGGYDTSPDLFDTALLDAMQAGILVATAAGNSGPEAFTIGNPSPMPWVMSVAAGGTKVSFQSVLSSDKNIQESCRASPDELGGDQAVVCRAITGFSSCGPSHEFPDVMKPDIAATGYKVLAGVSPYSSERLFAMFSGSSMASPFIAGIFALLREEHPDWTAAQAKSAIMTSANQHVLDWDLKPSTTFDTGSGHVDVRDDGNGSLIHPGLVYDISYLGYIGTLCAYFPESFGKNAAIPCEKWVPGVGGSLNPLNLNYPSITVTELLGTETVTRTVTSVAEGRVTYQALLDVPEGYEITVQPKEITLTEGSSVEYSVTITHTTANYGEWYFGAITWKSDDYQVRSPISIKSTSFLKPDIVTGRGVSGSADVNIQFGYSGAFAAASHGLEPAVVTTGTVPQDPDQSYNPGDGIIHEFQLADVARFRIAIPPEATEAGADLDVFVFDPTGSYYAESTQGATDELIDIEFPMDGKWFVEVHGYFTPGGDSDYNMYTWAIPATPPGRGNQVLDGVPESAVNGDTATISVNWSGAAMGEWHLGAVSFEADGIFAGITLVEVDNQ